MRHRPQAVGEDLEIWAAKGLSCPKAFQTFNPSKYEDKVY
jgi:hypothetical protein